MKTQMRHHIHLLGSLRISICFFITKILTEFLESSALNKKLVIHLCPNGYAI